MVDNNLFEGRVPRFNVGLDDNYRSWGLKIEAALERWQFSGALTNADVNEKTDRCAREILIAALGDNPLRAIQDCKSTKQA